MLLLAYCPSLLFCPAFQLPTSQRQTIKWHNTYLEAVSWMWSWWTIMIGPGLHAGVFDPLRPVAEQRCARPGAGMGVNLTLGPDRAIVRTHGYASSILEFEALLHGGERNLITQPVSLLPSKTHSGLSLLPDLWEDQGHEAISPYSTNRPTFTLSCKYPSMHTSGRAVKSAEWAIK